MNQTMSRRPVLIVTTMALFLGALVLAGCSRMVSVQTGERIVCTYGEVLTDTVKTVEVPAADAAKYKVVRETITCDRHKRLEALYAEAQAAILAGDLTTAHAKLGEIVKTEPQFRNAAAQIAAIDAGKTPAVDKGAPQPGSTATSGTTPAQPGGTGSAPGKEPIGPVASLSSFVPETLPGYTGDPITSDAFSLAREYVPTKAMPTDALVVVVEQYKDTAAAQSAIKYDLRGGYSTNGSTFTVAGRQVYFGTDSHRFAIVAWNEQGILVVIEASSKTGQPAGLKSHLTSLINAIVQ